MPKFPWEARALEQRSPTPRPGTGTRPYSRRGEQWVSEGSFICIYSCSPSIAFSPEFRLLSEKQQHHILTGAWTLLWTVHMSDLGCPLPMRFIQKPSFPQHTLPFWTVEKLSSTKLIPGAKKVGITAIDYTCVKILYCNKCLSNGFWLDNILNLLIPNYPLKFFFFWFLNLYQWTQQSLDLRDCFF